MLSSNNRSQKQPFEDLSKYLHVILGSSKLVILSVPSTLIAINFSNSQSESFKIGVSKNLR